jgi:hypothetical protein
MNLNTVAKSPNAYEFLELPNTSIQLDLPAIDDFLRSHGVKLTHYRAIRCPVGLTDRDDVNASHEDHADCSNGYLYTKAGDMSCFFLGNSQQPEWKDIGKLTVGMVQASFPRAYDDTQEEVDLCVFDRFYLNESITVSYWQTVQHHPSGIDRLHFLAVKVIDLVDNLGISYKQDVDFKVKDGRIVWGARSPGVDPENQRGRVYSVRYRYRPYFYLQRFVHEVRVSRQIDVDGNVTVASLPQAGVLTREYVFENKKRKPGGSQDPRLEIGEDDHGEEI